MSIPRKERRPTHEFLSELSVSQKQRLSTEKHHLKVRLDKLDVQRRRSLDVIDSERRMICNSLQLQQQDQNRLRNRQRSAKADRRNGNESGPEVSHPGYVRMSPTPESISISRSISVDLGKNGRRLSVPSSRDHLPKSADATKNRNSDLQDVERAKRAMSPARVLSLVQRRNSDTSTLTSLSVISRSSGKGFTFSQTPETDKLAQKIVHSDGDSRRRMSMPTLFPSLNTCGSAKLQSSRSLDADAGTPRSVERRLSLNTDRSRILRRNSIKKTQDGAVDKMAGMHNVLQRSAIFQIQENEGSDENEMNGS
ncbi:uncharacterized protein [Haliotis cracherodii]|uniref:uncharacterized protein n=1 Tax=Haliotis cracherodii TaxID=6455 RepID=UPI0039E81A2A